MSIALLIAAIAALVCLLSHLKSYPSIIASNSWQNALSDGQQLTLRSLFYSRSAFHLLSAAVLGASAFNYIAYGQVAMLLMFLSLIYLMQGIWFAYSYYCYYQGQGSRAWLHGLAPWVCAGAVVWFQWGG
ncbi:hypothetical protein [Paraferrimonas haliotis]|uniref:hypothetical protein n=1 Tax=Paraferrimonas haliotis TaxID=2013866 RepID=UPI000BA962F7|nr:hypothetical protein [Paraferrimonas haliotis]